MKTHQDPKILAETPRWLVLSKPSGWLTIAGRDRRSHHPVLLEWLKASHSPVWVVHRLDQDTSGLVLFARTAEDHRTANAWFQERKMKKTYLCLASGLPAVPVFKIHHAIQN